MGPECIVLVWNTAGGRRAEDLPFDIRHRTAPIEYCLDEKANASQRKKAMTGLAAKLKSALTPILVAALNRHGEIAELCGSLLLDKRLAKNKRVALWRMYELLRKEAAALDDPSSEGSLALGAVIGRIHDRFLHGSSW